MTTVLPLRSVVYTSQVATMMDDEAFDSLYRNAAASNALDGITGLLIFNGNAFLQVIEGSDSAIGDLLDRLARDQRHSDMIVHHDGGVATRSFRGWDMRALEVSRAYREAIVEIGKSLPIATPPWLHDMIALQTRRMSTELI